MITGIKFRFLNLIVCMFAVGCAVTPNSQPQTAPLVLMTDFGSQDGAVSTMKGVAYSVSQRLIVSDLTHEIPPFDIWQASFRLQQTYKYWPAGTVFVTVVDPGVGSQRRSIIVKTKSGHYFVGPDNGLLTHVLEETAPDSVIAINEKKMRRQGSEESYTFHGRDLYAFVGARLASGALSFKECGAPMSEAIAKLSFQKPEVLAQSNQVIGNIPVLDPNFGNVWSNIPKSLLQKQFPQAEQLYVEITHGKRVVFKGRLPLVETFARVKKGEGLLYFNSLLNLSLALNQGNFARSHGVGSGPDWGLSVRAK